ncbi:rhomboid-like protein [Nocardia sp. NPDC020380]|uniref:rhomboid-like protein n=1 Tax=Nocardia sp. NPDC020380 TaxID=3364309 RepID=UPI0037BD00C6
MTDSVGLRRLRITLGYTFLLLVSTTVLAFLSDPTVDQVMLRASTNLHNLLHGHIGTLLSSAFFIGTGLEAWLILAALGALLALTEMRFGGRRLVGIFLAGHVGATLIVAVGLWVGVRAGWLPDSIFDAEDVGISYGAMALIGALVAVLPPRLRWFWYVFWPLVAVDGVLVGQTFTNVGHLLSVLIGLSLGFFMIRRRSAPRPLSIVECGWLAVSVILGGSLLLG